MKEHNIDIVCLQELKKAQASNSLLSFPGYETFVLARTVPRSDPRYTYSGGGIATLVKTSLTAKPVFSSEFTTTERLDVQVQTGFNTLVVVNVYLPPIGAGKDTRTEDFMCDTLPHDPQTVISAAASGFCDHQFPSNS